MISHITYPRRQSSKKQKKPPSHILSKQRTPGRWEEGEGGREGGRGGDVPSVDADVLGAEGLDGELLDLTDGAGGTLLEGDLVQALVQVDGVEPTYEEEGRKERVSEEGCRWRHGEGEAWR